MIMELSAKDMDSRAQVVGSSPTRGAMKKVPFVGRQKGLFSMISVPVGTGDIADAMISASQMIYASRMEERILYHACAASISFGASRISYRVSDISLKNAINCDIIIQ